jgi:DNA-binding transcriptional LysR family regulator
MSDFDLNLLRVFDLLYEEGSVTKAAMRLRLTQSAVSHSLARLREMLGDPLFVKVPTGLQPTERAHQLAPRLRIAFADIQSAVAAPRFDPATSTRHFTVAAGWYFCGITVCLIGLLRRSAPGVTLQVTTASHNITQALDQQQVDIVLGGFERIPSRFRSEVLFHDELVWVIGAHHPLANQRPDHKTLLAQPRLGINSAFPVEKPSVSSRDELIRHMVVGLGDEGDSTGSARQVRGKMLVYDADTAMAITAATDMAALVPRCYAETCASSGRIRVIELPKGRLKPIPIMMTWHGRCDEDSGSIWLRHAIRDSLKLATEEAHRHKAFPGIKRATTGGGQRRNAGASGKRAKATRA